MADAGNVSATNNNEVKATPIKTGYPSEYRPLTHLNENQKQLPESYKYIGSHNSNGLPHPMRRKSSQVNGYKQPNIRNPENAYHEFENTSSIQVVGNKSANPRRIPSILKRSASTVSDIQYMRGGRGLPVTKSMQYTCFYTYTHIIHICAFCYSDLPN